MKKFQSNISAAKKAHLYASEFILGAVRHQHDLRTVPLQRLYMEFMLRGMASDPAAAASLKECYSRYFSENPDGLDAEVLAQAKSFVDRTVDMDKL